MMCVRKYDVFGVVLRTCSSKKVSFVILLLQVGLVGKAELGLSLRLGLV